MGQHDHLRRWFEKRFGAAPEQRAQLDRLGGSETLPAVFYGDDFGSVRCNQTATTSLL